MGADREPLFPEWGVEMEKYGHFHYCYSPRSSFALRASALSFSLNTHMACPARSLKGWGERSRPTFIGVHSRHSRFQLFFI